MEKLLGAGKPDGCKGCPLYESGTGFVLGSGDPSKARIALILEAPGKQEVIWRIDDPGELVTRRRDYGDKLGPGNRFIEVGQPVVGASGSILFGWGLVSLQLTRKDLYIDNTLRCLPPKVGNQQYPKGAERKKAEAWCNQYSRMYNKVVFISQCDQCGSKKLLYDTNMQVLPQKFSGSYNENGKQSEQTKFTDVLLDPVFSRAVVEEFAKNPQMQVSWMREDIQSSPTLSKRVDSETTKLLHKGVLYSSSNEISYVQARNHTREEIKKSSPFGGEIQKCGIHFRKDSEKISVGSRTSFSDGKGVGTEVKALGVGSSQECSQNRQQRKEPRVGSLEQPLREDLLSVLQKAFHDSLNDCECGGHKKAIGTFIGGFNPTVSIVNIHPASVARDPVTLPLMIKTFEKAKHFSMTGDKPLVLCGGKAVQAWMGYAGTVQTWLGHFQPETELTHQMRVRRVEDGMKVSTEKKVKVKKLKAKDILQKLVEGAQQFLTGDQGCEVGYKCEISLSEVEFKELIELAAPKTKKVKEGLAKKND